MENKPSNGIGKRTKQAAAVWTFGLLLVGAIPIVLAGVDAACDESGGNPGVSPADPGYSYCLNFSGTCTTTTTTSSGGWFIFVFFAGIFDTSQKVTTKLNCSGTYLVTIDHFAGDVPPIGIGHEGAVPLGASAPVIPLGTWNAVTTLDGGTSADDIDSCSYLPQVTSCTTSHDASWSFEYVGQGTVTDFKSCGGLSIDTYLDAPIVGDLYNQKGFNGCGTPVHLGDAPDATGLVAEVLAAVQSFVRK